MDPSTIENVDSKIDDGTKFANFNDSKSSFSYSVEESSKQTKDNENSEVDDTFDEKATSSIRRRRRLRSSRLRYDYVFSIANFR